MDDHNTRFHKIVKSEVAASTIESTMDAAPKSSRRIGSDDAGVKDEIKGKSKACKDSLPALPHAAWVTLLTVHSFSI